MLLILITGLFAAAWSTDSGHTATPAAQPGSHSRSAVAILMQTTAVEPPADEVYDISFADDAGIGCPRIVSHSRLAASMWIVSAVRETGEFHSSLVLDEPVEAPLPGRSRSSSMLVEPPIDAPIPIVAALDIPVEAPIPVVDAGPVIAPVPATTALRWVGRNSRLPVLSTVALRVKMDYRMTCHCCREYCGIAARKVAALRRQSQQAVSDLAQTLSQAVNGIDWNTRLSSEPADGSKRRL